MAGVLQVFSQSGALPLKATLEVDANGPVLIMISGTAWTKTANTQLGVVLRVDGGMVAAASVFSNLPNLHVPLVAAFVPYKFSSGQHTFTLEASNADTLSDGNDNYNVTLLY